MTEIIAPVNVANDAWVDLVNSVNDIIDALASNVASTSAAVNGNIIVNGSIYGNTVYSESQKVVNVQRTIAAGTGLGGGGSLANNITISLNSNTTALLDKANTALQAGDFSGKIGLQEKVNMNQINATGTANSTTFLAGDGVYRTPAGGGGANNVLTVNGSAPDGFGDVSLAANNIPTTATGNVGSTTVQAAIAELDSEKVSTTAFPSANGIIVKTEANTFTNRELTTANASFITLANANGVSGNPSVSLSANAISSLGLANSAIQPNGAQTLNQKTLQNPIIMGSLTETVYTITDGGSVVLSPNNGTIQIWVLGANRTPTAANTWAVGQSMTLIVWGSSSYTINWGSVTPNLYWIGGSAPALVNDKNNVIELWKSANNWIGGAYAGDI